ncbi:MAG: helix-turn-helix transcriptional regulator, partial [bacterium]|nr:helix-turn-helix transcriptional regulator [bacterium]
SCGCVAALMKGSLESARHTRFRWRRELCELWCVPAGEVAVCILCSTTPQQPEDWQRLTPRQLDVLGLVAAGETTAGIATRLDVTAATVRTHVEHIRGKLGATTRAAMVAQAFRLGLLD